MKFTIKVKNPHPDDTIPPLEYCELHVDPKRFNLQIKHICNPDEILIDKPKTTIISHINLMRIILKDLPELIY